MNQNKYKLLKFVPFDYMMYCVITINLRLPPPPLMLKVD